MNILGLNAYHGDVSAALVRDGRLVAAVEEERFRRIKHFAGFPIAAIAECLRMGGLTAADVDLFAVSRDPRAHLWRKALFLLRHGRGTLGDRARNAVRSWRVWPHDRRAARARRRRGASRTRFVEHHPSHLASAAFVSPFDDAAVCAIDGFGDFVSTSWGRVAGTRAARRRPRLLSALARPAVPRDHAVSRVPEVRRRVQGDGPGAVRRAALRRAR